MEPAKKIETLNDLIEIVGDWEMENPQRGNTTHWIWYRGQPNEADKPVPGAERELFISEAKKKNDSPYEDQRPFRTEVEINTQFRRLGASFFEAGADSVRVYFMAQHYGLPTRLLDWTTNPLAALFFAVCSQPDTDGRLFVIKINQIGRTNLKMPQSERGHDVAQTVKFLFDEGPEPAHPGIIPVLPDHRFPRMAQQGSCFTLHMPRTERLVFGNQRPEEGAGGVSYLIPRGMVKRQLLETLRRLNITWASLFPGLDHLAREIRAAFGLAG